MNKLKIKKIITLILSFILIAVIIIDISKQQVKAAVTFSWDNLYSSKDRYQSNIIEGDSAYGDMYKEMMDSQGWAPAPVYKLYYKLDGGTKTAMSYDSSTYTNGQGGYEIMLRVDGEDKWLGKSSYRYGSTNVGDFYDCWHDIKLSNLYFTPREINGDKFLQINMELTNIGSTTKTFSLATSGDIQIADDDNAAIQYLGNGFSMSNRFCTTSEFYGGNVKTATLNVYAKNAPYVTDADAVGISIYANRRNNIWNNNVLGDTTTRYNFKRHRGDTGFDSAFDASFSIAWKNRTIASGEKKTYSYIIGVGDYKPVNTIYFNPNTTDISYYDNFKYCQVTFDTTNNNSTSYKPTREGYIFDGWWTTTDESGIKMFNADGSCNKGTSYWDNSGKWQGFTDVTVYAHWKPKQYTITLDSNGATKNGTTSTTVNFRGKTSNITVPEQKYNIRYHTTSDEGSSVFKTDVQENNFLGYYNSSNYSKTTPADPAMVMVENPTPLFSKESLNYELKDFRGKSFGNGDSYKTNYVQLQLETNEVIYSGCNNGIHILLDGKYSGYWIIKPHDYNDDASLSISSGNGNSLSIDIDDRDEDDWNDTTFMLKAENSDSLDILIEADSGNDLYSGTSYVIDFLFVSTKEYPDKTKAIYNSDGVMQYDYNIAKDTTLTARWSGYGVSIPSTDAYGNKVKYWITTDGHVYYPFDETDEDEEFSKDTDLYPVYATAHLTTFSGKGISSTNYAGGADINIGENVTVSAALKEGYKFVNWTDSNGNEVSKDKDYTFAMPGNDVNLTANAELNSYPVTVNVRYQDADGNWGAYETVINSNYDYGSTVSWSNSDKINSDAVYKAAYKAASYSETVKGAVTKNIDIERNKYTITVNKGSHISSVSGGGTYYYGKKIQISATPDTGYSFSGWNDSDKSNPRTITVTGNVSYTANAKVNQYAVTYIDVADSIDGKELGRITRQIDYGVKVDGSDLGADKTLGKYYAGYEYASSTNATVGLDGATVYRIFMIHNYSITYNLDGGILPDGKSNPATYTVEDTFTLNNPAKPGYTFAGWSGTGITGSDNKTVTVAKGSTGDRSYTAHYTANIYKITYKKGNTDVNGNDVEQNVTFNADTTTKPANTFTGRTYNVTYNQGYTDNRSWETTVLPSNISNAHLTFKNWSIDGKNVTKNAGETFKYTYTENVTMTAQWNTAEIKLTGVERTGYTFAGWKCNVDGKIYNAGDTYTISEDAAALNVTFTAQWTADTNTKYVVNHWKQNIGSDAGKHDSSNYTLAETYNLTGITDTPVTPAVKTYTGFTSPDVQTVNINGDGSTVVNYYYTRNKYKIDDGGNNDGTGSDDGSGDTGNDKGNGIKDITGGGEYYYEEEVSMEAVVKRGYHWHIDDDCHTDRSKYPTGWTVTKPGYGIEKFLDNTNYGTQKIRFVMPAHDVYVRADATNNSYTIEFERNGGTGNMPAIEATYAVPVTLPDNSFTKTTAFGNSTFLYWEDAKNDTTYDDKSVVESLTDEFNGTVILKAAWDDCPEITAQERWFTVDDSQNGKITLEELLSTAKVTDDRDSDIEEKLTVKYYQPNLFTQFKTDGYVMVTYTATDSSNNTTEVTVKVNIVDTVAVEQEKNTYARFIAPQYYKESYENGGLEDDSIWKKDPDYAAVLESAMNNRESMYYEYIETELYGVPFRIRKQACEYSDHLMEKWVFTKDDVKAVKKYVNEHGIGNLKEADALANFRIQFAHCRQQ